MGRNQFDITNEDIKELREYFLRQQQLTPEEQAAKEAEQETIRKKQEADFKERRRVAKEERKRKEAEAEALRKARIEKANEKFRAAGLWEMSTEPIDPHLKMAHADYLKTPLWKRIRKRILKRDNNICQLCGNRASVVHHRSYDNDVLLGTNDNHLISLCNECHEKIEFTNEGTHRTVEQKESLLQSLLGEKI
jgi:hypothetical protein